MNYNKRYIVQLGILEHYVDVKEYKILDYAIKYCKKNNVKYNFLKYRVVEVIYDETIRI